MSDVRRKSIENQILKKAKIRIVAYKGGFDGLVSKEEIYNAKVRGLMPQGFETHHIIPMCCRNTRMTLDNMVIVDSATHKFLHRYVYDKALNKCTPGQMTTVFLPDFDINKVLRYDLIDIAYIEKMRGRERC